MSAAESVLEKLKQSFISELPEKIDEIESSILACGEGDSFDEHFQEAYRKTHSLKGIGGTFGVSVITSICHQLEEALNLWDKPSFDVACPRQSRCLDYIDLLRQVCDLLQGGRESFDLIREQLHRFADDDFKNKLRVLVVDSSRTTRQICQQILSAYNVDVVEMTDGYEALGRILEERFDVLIAGKEIGLLNGQVLISIASELVSDKHQIKTIMITSSSNRPLNSMRRCIDPSLIVKKGVGMIAELEAELEVLTKPVR